MIEDYNILTKIKHTNTTESLSIASSSSFIVESISNSSLASRSGPISPCSLDIPSKKYILYLEPHHQSALYQSVLEFFRISEAKFGKNEAHMYHPHTSLTGFFDVPIVNNIDFDSYLLSYLDCILSKMNLPLSPPSIGEIHRPSRQPDSLCIRIHSPQALRDLVSSFKDNVDEMLKKHYFLPLPPSCRVRQKPVDHISLAYLRSVRQAQGESRLMKSDLDALHTLARSTVKLEAPNEWFMVLYEVDRSENLFVSHRFRELKKWKIA